jgi:hypothetical protein
MSLATVLAVSLVIIAGAVWAMTRPKTKTELPGGGVNPHDGPDVPQQAE